MDDFKAMLPSMSKLTLAATVSPEEAAMRQAATTRYYAGELMRTASCADKQRVLSFMSSLDPVAAAAGYVRDEVTGGYVIGVTELAYEHAGWEWYQRDIYHLDMYDLEFDPDFIAMALS